MKKRVSTSTGYYWQHMNDDDLPECIYKEIDSKYHSVIDALLAGNRALAVSRMVAAESFDGETVAWLISGAVFASNKWASKAIAKGALVWAGVKMTAITAALHVAKIRCSRLGCEETVPSKFRLIKRAWYNPAYYFRAWCYEEEYCPPPSFEWDGPVW